MSDDSAHPVSSFARTLSKLGLTTKAARVDETGRKIGQRDGNCDKWWTWTPWESGLRTSRATALKKSKERIAKHACVESLIGDSFGVLTLLFPLSLDPTRGTEKLTFFTLRDLLKRLLPNFFICLGTRRSNMALKVISVEPLTSELIDSIQIVMPRLVTLEWANRPACDFRACLQRLFSPDLPDHDEDRARLEYVMEHIKQVAAFGSVYAVIGIREDNIYQLPRSSLKTKERPRNPKTDALALCHTTPRVEKVTFDDIDPLDWLQYNEIEIDCTTTADRAAMLQTEPPHPPPAIPQPAHQLVRADPHEYRCGEYRHKRD